MAMPIRSSRGFTLIEMVMTITLLSIIAVVLAPVLSSSVSIYAADTSRAALIQKGRLALERIAREVREAVPNTLEIVTDAGGNTGFQFLQARTGGRYVDLLDTFTLLAFINPARRFQTVTPMTQLYILGTGHTLAADDSLIIRNADPSEIRAGTTIVTPTGISPTTLLADGTVNGQVFTFGAHTFVQGSPGRHYFLSNQTHEIGRVGNALYWHTATGTTGYNMNGDWSNADPMLVDGVTAVTFTYTAGTPAATAVMRMSLSLSDGSENIDLYQEVHIRNTM